MRNIQCTSRSQQAFSSDMHPTLAKAIPAMEGLHKSWEKQSTDDRYAPFHHVLLAGMDKINKYYERTEDSDAYIFSMSELLILVFITETHAPSLLSFGSR